MYKVTFTINKNNFQMFEDFLFVLSETINVSIDNYCNLLDWVKKVIKKHVNNNATILVYLGCRSYSNLVEFTYGWDPLEEGTVEGVSVDEFTETDFPKIFKALGFEFPFESYQIYLINKELNGN